MNKWRDHVERGNRKGLLPQHKAFVGIVFEWAEYRRWVFNHFPGFKYQHYFFKNTTLEICRLSQYTLDFKIQKSQNFYVFSLVEANAVAVLSPGGCDFSLCCIEADDIEAQYELLTLEVRVILLTTLVCKKWHSIGTPLVFISQNVRRTKQTPKQVKDIPQYTEFNCASFSYFEMLSAQLGGPVEDHHCIIYWELTLCQAQY